MVIDVHVHPEFFQAAFIDDAATALRKKVMGRDKIGYSPTEFIIKKMDYAGIDKQVLLPLDLTTQCGCVIVTNDEMAGIVREAPDRFIGFASVDPFRKDALEVLDYAFGTLKLKGLKLNPSKQRFFPDNPLMDPIYRKCLEYDKPVMFHAGMSWEPNTPAKYSKPLCFEEVAINYPGLRMCLAHFGWPWVRDTAMMILKYPNVYADTAMLYMDRAPDFYRQIFKMDLSPLWLENCINKKVMFGSNEPRFGPGDLKWGVESLGLRSRTTARILGGNAIEFLGGL